MGSYGGGTLPVTGAALTIGAAHFTTPLIALTGAAIVVAGLLLLRVTRRRRAKVGG